ARPATRTHPLPLHDALPILLHAAAIGTHAGRQQWNIRRTRFTRDSPRAGRPVSWRSPPRKLSFLATNSPCAFPSRKPASNSAARSEEHTSELQSRENLVCRL